MKTYIFDVDGTLTPSRGKINQHFDRWFNNWIDLQQSLHNQVWLISGSDLPKTVEQMGIDIVNKIDRCYNCMGNTLYQKGTTVYEREFNPSAGLISYLEHWLERSEYPDRYGQHIEYRSGMLNYSIVGRGAVGKQRTDYYNWDLVNHEREIIATRINSKFKSENIVALVGGETGLDITKHGWDKSQILPEIHGPAIFVGDKMSYGENDYPLKYALDTDNRGFKHRCHHVSGWSETLGVLSGYMA